MIVKIEIEVEDEIQELIDDMFDSHFGRPITSAECGEILAHVCHAQIDYWVNSPDTGELADVVCEFLDENHDMFVGDTFVGDEA